jgi:predicted lipid-binding transport protein (Tim44 family)
MKKSVALVAIVLALGMAVAMDAEARRLGGGKSAGMQRQNITAPANRPGAPAQAAPAAGTAANAAAPAAAATAKRSWMGPIAGLAAGLGLAALMSHLGLGEAFANMLMIGLLAMVAMALVSMVLRKRAAAQGGSLAGAGGMGRPGRAQQHAVFRGVETPQQGAGGGSLIGSRLMGGSGAAAGDAQVGSIPADFDTAAFVRNAKDQFMALQAANDARDLDRLRDYLSSEMFASVQAEIAERGDVPQQTAVFGLEAQVLDVAQEADRYVVSVRFTGSVREQASAVPEDLDEVWHLVKPRSGFGGWVIAGIQQAV